VLRGLAANKRLPALIVAIAVGILLIGGGVSILNRQQRTIQVAAAGTYTALAPTLTATLTQTPTDTPTITLTPSETPTGTLPPTDTPTITFTPSPTAVPPHVVRVNGTEYPTPVEPPSTAIPTPVDPVDVPGGVINILLMGSDRRPDDGSYRTDSLIVVSINREEGTVNMLSLPRDLYVYIPGWTMNRINTADGRGAAIGWPGGGPGLIKETLLYNFGIVIHYYARVDFDNFQQIVDALGGVDVPVDCSIQGWRLKAPRQTRADFASQAEWLDYTKEPDKAYADFGAAEPYIQYVEDNTNWQAYTMPVGVQHLDGYMALWYARRRTGIVPGQSYDDYDRARRQQQVLRAIFNKSQSLGLLPRAPELWQQYSDLVETDMGLGNILQLLPVAANMDSSKISSFVLGPAYVIGWKTPSGEAVSLPVPEAVQPLVAQAMQPPAENYVVSNSVKVEVRNGTATDRMDEVAADRFAREGGMNVVATGLADKRTYPTTIIYDYTGRQKAGELLVLQRLLKVSSDQVIVQPDPNRAFDYVVILGADYLNRSCTENVPAGFQPTPPVPTLTPKP